MWTYNEAAIELAAAVFCKLLQEHQAMSFVTKLNSWRRKHYKIRLDSFLYSSGFTAKINTMGWDGILMTCHVYAWFSFSSFSVPVIVEKFTTDLVKI